MRKFYLYLLFFPCITWGQDIRMLKDLLIESTRTKILEEKIILYYKIHEIEKQRLDRSSFSSRLSDKEKEILELSRKKIKKIQHLANSFEAELTPSEIKQITADNPASLYREVAFLPLSSEKSSCYKKDYRKLEKAYSTKDIKRFIHIVAEYIYLREYDSYTLYYKNIIDLINSTKKYQHFQKGDLTYFYKYLQMKLSLDKSKDLLEEEQRLVLENFFAREIPSKEIFNFSRQMFHRAPGCFKMNDPSIKKFLKQSLVMNRGRLIWSKILEHVETKQMILSLYELDIKEYLEGISYNKLIDQYSISYHQNILSLETNAGILVDSIKLNRSISIQKFKIQDIVSIQLPDQPPWKVPKIHKGSVRSSDCYKVRSLSQDPTLSALKMMDKDCLLTIEGKKITSILMFYRFLENIKAQIPTNIMLYRGLHKILLRYFKQP